MGICGSTHHQPFRRRNGKVLTATDLAYLDSTNLLLDCWSHTDVKRLLRKFREGTGKNESSTSSGAPTFSSARMDQSAFMEVFRDQMKNFNLPPSIASNAFRLFDHDDNGTLDVREFCVAISLCCVASREEKVRLVFDLFDLNGDGRLSANELRTLLQTAVQSPVTGITSSSSHLSVSTSTAGKESSSSPWDANFESKTTQKEDDDGALVWIRKQEAILLGHGDVKASSSSSPMSRTTSRLWSKGKSEKKSNGNANFSGNRVADIVRDVLPLRTPRSTLGFERFREWALRGENLDASKLLRAFSIISAPSDERRAVSDVLLCDNRRNRHMRRGEIWYVVSHDWWNDWVEYTQWNNAFLFNVENEKKVSKKSDNNDSSTPSAAASPSAASPSSSPLPPKPPEEAPQLQMHVSSAYGDRPSAIDNSDIAGSVKNTLRPGLVEHSDYVLVPEDLWQVLWEWYGGGPSFPRVVLEDSENVGVMFPSRDIKTRQSSSAIDLYPLVLSILIMEEDTGRPISGVSTSVTISRNDTLQNLLLIAMKQLQNEGNTDENEIDEKKKSKKKNPDKVNTSTSDTDLSSINGSGESRSDTNEISDHSNENENTDDDDDSGDCKGTEETEESNVGLLGRIRFRLRSQKNEKKNEDDGSRDDDDPCRVRLWYKAAGDNWQLIKSELMNCSIDSIDKLMEDKKNSDLKKRIDSGDAFMIERAVFKEEIGGGGVDEIDEKGSATIKKEEKTWQWPSELAMEKERQFRNFEVNDRVDAQDSKGTWYNGTVVEIIVRHDGEDDDGNQDENESNDSSNSSSDIKIVINFDGWSSKWNEYFPSNSKRLQPLGTKVVKKSIEKKTIKNKSVFSRLENFSSTMFGGSTQSAYYYGSEGFNYDRTRRAIRRGYVSRRGAKGLGNIGNTCYMNSVVQCLSHSNLLRKYLLSNKWKEEVNVKNKDGTGGVFTESFSNLLEELWDEPSGNRMDNLYVLPYEFKNQLSSAHSQFRGYEQQDAQEVALACIMTCHEDLQRIQFRIEEKKKKKKSSEKKKEKKEMSENNEKNGVSSENNNSKKTVSEKNEDKRKTSKEDDEKKKEDDSEIILESDAEQARKAIAEYKKRNRSTIADLFFGMERGSLACSECGYRSLRFEAFQVLSVQLPLKQRTIEVIVYSANCTNDVVRYQITVPQRSAFGELKETLSTKCEISPNRLQLFQLTEGKLTKAYNDYQPVRSLSGSIHHVLVAFEFDCKMYELKESLELKEEKVKKTFWPWSKMGTNHDSDDDDERDEEDREKPIFQVNGRVDVLDDEGNWLPATILTIETEEEAEERVRKEEEKNNELLLKSTGENEDENENDDVVVSDNSEENLKNEKIMKTRLARIRFDGYAKRWDELHPIADEGEICTKRVKPLHTKTVRPALEVLQVQVIHRVITNGEDATVKIFGTPFILTYTSLTSATELLKMVHDRGKSFISKSCEESIQSLFDVCFVDMTGTKSKRGSKKAPNVGDPLLPTSNLPNLRQEMLSLDWKKPSFYCDLEVIDFEKNESETPISERESNQNNVLELKDCLKAYAAPEMVGSVDDPIWSCPKCKCKRAASRRLEVWSAPDLICIHLMRFAYTAFAREKLSTPIRYPIRGFDLSPFIVGDTSSNSDNIYDLYGVVNHYGRLSGGHYTSYCLHGDRTSIDKNDATEEWYEFDDDRVRKIEEEEVQSQNAYMLFYRRRSVSGSNLINLAI
eukprot:g1377.t1